MGESHNQVATSSRLGIKNTGGEIVEVQGGHIVRSTGRKDRHSKVCTAKGPRDRRVRLSAHTAIQFYDVQDRLGYDRPSKAVDWLIKKAKPSIDELEKLPAWKPTATFNATIAPNSSSHQRVNVENENPIAINRSLPVNTVSSSVSRRRKAGMVGTVARNDSLSQSTSELNFQQQMVEQPSNSSGFLPPSLDSDAIADTIKSFFPIGASTEAPPSTIQFHQSYPPDLLSRTSSHSQDLRLSLQSFQDPILLQHQQAQQHQSAAQTHQNEQALFCGTATTQMGFDGSSSGWSEHHHQQAEMNRFQRMVAWIGGDTGSGGGESGGFMLNSLPTPSQSLQQPPLQPFFGRNQFFSQRGPLQSSNSPSIRAWVDPSFPDHQFSSALDQSSISGMGFASGGFSGFRIPARIQGGEEHDGISDKPSSASSDSRH